jgi:hypothetical protein
LNLFNFGLDNACTPAYLLFEHVQYNENLEETMHIVISYAIYLAISINLTIWVARTLHKRGAIFLVDAFQGNAELAASVNHLLVVGFYLINIGFVSLALKSDAVINTTRGAIEMLSDKLGWVLLILGIMHFFNLLVFSRIRHKGLSPSHPPVTPDAYLRVPPPPPPFPRNA